MPLEGVLVIQKLSGLPRSVFAICSALVLVALVLVGGGGQAAATRETSSATRLASSDPQPTIVLVHGDWADASSWNEVIERLQERGFNVVAPPNTLRGPNQDSPYLASYLQSISGPIVLVAHSYGGFVATNAATGNPNVKALVYIDAFAPDENERAIDLLAQTHSCVSDRGLIPVPFDGGVDLYLRWEANPPYEGFRECFANGVNGRTARLLFAGQRPAAEQQFFDASGPPAWKTIESWSLIGMQDNVLPPDLLEMMSERAGAHITRVKAGHLTPITRPGAVVRVIRSAVEATS
jgi:pimeloyl-ACP methyl ester carboxylesterase